VALRSYARRFRDAVLPIADDPSVEALAERIGPDGHSALDRVVTVANTWAMLQQALRQVLISDDAVLHAGIVDPGEREWEVPPGTSVDGALDRLADESAALADAVDAVPGRDWSRTATVAGGATISAIDLVREAVRTGAQGLADAESAVRAARNAS